MPAGLNIPLVGRVGELETLTELLGRGGIALLAGEPGVGKTRLARAFTELAERRGATTLWGAAYDEWSAPYGPWAHALAPYLRALAPQELGGDAAVLAAVVPDLRTTETAPALGLRDEEVRLHEAVVRLLAAADRTVVVVLDDLHWADRASLDLLLSVARAQAVGVLVVATVRDRELADPVTRCLAQLTRERLAQRLDVQPLNPTESAALLELLEVDASAAAAIYERAHGNPFFTEELARDVRERGAQAPGTPASVRMTVSSRVARLSPEAGRLLELASVFTRPFAFAAIQALAELPEETLLDVVDEALAAGLLRVARPADESYEFAHAIVRQSLLEQLNPSRRARLHRRVAQALEALDGAPETAAELAAQYHRSASLPGAAHGVAYALTAAADAERRYARAEAARLLRIARDLSGELEPQSRSDVLCRLALAEAEALQLDEARETAAAALAALANAGAARETTIDFVWSLARLLKEAGAPEEQLRPFVERGLELVGAARDLRWARLMLVLRPAEPMVYGRIQAERWLGYDPEAVRVARSSGSERDYAETLELMDWRSREDVDSLLAVARSWREPSARIHALSVAARTLLYNLGAFREARDVSRELLEESERVGSLSGAAYALEQIADVEIAFGEFDAAREHLDRARAAARSLGPAHRLHFIIGFVEHRFASYIGGQQEASAAAFERAATDGRSPWPWITIQAAALAALDYARVGEREAAERILDELLPLLETLEPTTLNQNSAVVIAAAAAWQLEDIERAARVQPLALALVDTGVGDYVSGSNDLTLARIATLLGDAQDAAEWFARARAILREDGRVPLQAIAVVEGAAAALAAGLPPDLAELRAASSRLGELGMTEWAQRAGRLLERAEATPPAGLTSREVDVLRLLARGQTNREIAATLVVSVHTIERHLANAYRKIGARNRADATAFALREL